MKTAIKIKDKEFMPFILEANIKKRVKELGSEISQDLANKNPLFIVVLNGAMFFAVDLFFNITICLNQTMA